MSRRSAIAELSAHPRCRVRATTIRMAKLEQVVRRRDALITTYHDRAATLGEDLPARGRLREWFLARNAELLEEQERCWRALLYGEEADDVVTSIVGRYGSD
ncbi:hypothetical protein HN371_08065 [Candidatus Poribacteria bacterium]|jgi:hypothetical protein|nr:hypothetical protein [Candidatus Poribacteria bacterium]MBT5534859.1 hypothetical protein [Candidatus Poribacteria bacterium]MBT7805359.1 hypothetical protein [Candidatus Poribacteria bacterium]